MFGKHSMFKLFVAIAVAASFAVLGARSAKAQTFITDTLGGNGHPKVQAVRGLITDTLAPGGRMSLYHRWFLIEHAPAVVVPQGYRLITDTLGNRRLYSRVGSLPVAYNPDAYVPGGASQSVSQAIQSLGYGDFRSAAVARKLKAARVHSSVIITDTLGGNGHAVRHAQTPRVVKATCTTTPGWAFTTDDQGNPWLMPTGSALSRDCGSTSALSPPAGWKIVIDDLGNSLLEPIGGPWLPAR